MSSAAGSPGAATEPSGGAPRGAAASTALRRFGSRRFAGFGRRRTTTRARSGRPPAGVPSQQNTPSDPAALPPWATASAEGSSVGSADGSPGPDRLADRSVAGMGLAGSAADQMAGGPSPQQSNANAVPAWTASAGATLAAAPHEDLAGLVAGPQQNDAAGTPAELRPMPPPPRPSPPPSSQRPPQVSSTRPRSSTSGPPWERGRRFDAYRLSARGRGCRACRESPCWRSRWRSRPSHCSSCPPCSGSEVAVGAARHRARARAVRGHVEWRTVARTRPHPPSRSTSSRPATRCRRSRSKFGVTIDELLRANKDTIKNPDKIDSRRQHHHPGAAAPERLLTIGGAVDRRRRRARPAGAASGARC